MMRTVFLILVTWLALAAVLTFVLVTMAMSRGDRESSRADLDAELRDLTENRD